MLNREETQEDQYVWPEPCPCQAVMLGLYTYSVNSSYYTNIICMFTKVPALVRDSEAPVANGRPRMICEEIMGLERVKLTLQ